MTSVSLMMPKKLERIYYNNNYMIIGSVCCCERVLDSFSRHTSRCILKFLKFLTSIVHKSHLKALLTLWILRCIVADELWRKRIGQMPQINCRSFVCSPIWFRSPRRVRNFWVQWSQLYFRICVWHSMWLLRSNFLRNFLWQKSQANFIGSVLWTSWCLYSRAEFLKDDGQSVHTKALEKRERDWNEKSMGCYLDVNVNLYIIYWWSEFGRQKWIALHCCTILV